MPRPEPSTVWMVGRVIDSKGLPVEGVSASVSRVVGPRIDAADPSTGDVHTVRTNKDGIFELCPSIFRVGDTVRVQVTHRAFPPQEFLRELAGPLTVFALVRLSNR